MFIIFFILFIGSTFHRTNLHANLTAEKDVNIINNLSIAKLKEMKQSRTALLKIISSLLYLTRQGMALRGHTDDNSNFYQLLKLRSNDSKELEGWLMRTKFKWISHEVQNEILSLLSQYVQTYLINQIKSAKYFSIIIDETTDNTCTEQVSICFRIVDDNFNISELFLGFFDTEYTNSIALFTLITNVLTKFGLAISDCRGQCYDGAANVSGHISGLQKRIVELENRAIYVHCVAHTLNLVVQDAMLKIDKSRDFLSMIKSIIVFVRSSPKRQAIFNTLQAEQDIINCKTLRPFCPTRWCMRIKSLKTLYDNYAVLIEFLHNISKEKNENGAKASGYSKQLLSFDFLFYTKVMIIIFERVEILNAELQRISLSFQEAQLKIENIFISIQQLRDTGFDDLWEQVLVKSSELKLKKPNEQRIKKIPKKLLQGNNEGHTFSSVREKYKITFYELLDVTLSSLNNRFQKNVINHLCELEKFIIGKEKLVTYVSSFYGIDFDQEKLQLHRDMFLDIVKSRKISINSTQDAIDVFKSDNSFGGMLTEFNKLLKIILTVPVSSCTAERSFSALRRLKTFLRSTMTQNRLNDIALLHVHRNEDIDIEQIANSFINSSKIRQNTFFL